MRQPISFGSAAPWRLFPLKALSQTKKWQGINAENQWKLDQGRREGKDLSKTKIDLQKSTKALRNKEKYKKRTGIAGKKKEPSGKVEKKLDFK